MNEIKTSGYHFESAEAEHSHRYLWEPVKNLLASHCARGARVFDLGCGNGALARWLDKLGYQVAGVDPSEGGIKHAHEASPELNLQSGSAYDPLAEKFGTFPALVSLEVVEHVYFPRMYAACVKDLLEPGGIAIISTPYHGYFKNLVLAATGKLDAHFTALWDHGHIKFWSVKTLTALFAEQGLTLIDVQRVGRIPALAKSMILTFKKESQV
jgi:2-polyprenyl-3-methyl-5-hydroxy-6-metoxy-1,4-benzoquinol methylase